MIVDDALAGKIALLCNYIAAGSPAAEDSDALIVPSETALRLSRAISSCFLFKLEYIPANSAELFFNNRFSWWSVPVGQYQRDVCPIPSF